LSAKFRVRRHSDRAELPAEQEQTMRDQETEIVELGAASEVTLGDEFPLKEEAGSIPDYRD
jgi:hypothetical protein